MHAHPEHCLENVDGPCTCGLEEVLEEEAAENNGPDDLENNGPDLNDCDEDEITPDDIADRIEREA
jgi:hypothetical protein